MTAKRLLLLGTTGVDKAAALIRLQRWCKGFYRNVVPVDFEREFLFNTRKGGRPTATFLDSDLRTQTQWWREAWARFQDEHSRNVEDDFFLGIHGCYIRGHYGVRSVLDAQLVAGF